MQSQGVSPDAAAAERMAGISPKLNTPRGFGHDRLIQRLRELREAEQRLARRVADEAGRRIAIHRNADRAAAGSLRLELEIVDLFQFGRRDPQVAVDDLGIGQFGRSVGR